jgi:hypothetical protein
MDLRNELSIFDEIQKINEANLVRHGIPVERKYTDEQLVPYYGAVMAAEAQLAVAANGGQP